MNALRTDMEGRAVFTAGIKCIRDCSWEMEPELSDRYTEAMHNLRGVSYLAAMGSR